MQFEYEVLDDDLSKEVAKCCSNEYVSLKVAPSGMIVGGRYLQFAQAIRNFKVREDDVFLISHPRSGHTLLSELIWLLKNGMDFEKAKEIKLYERFFFLEFTHGNDLDYYLKLLNHFENTESPRCLRSHLFKPHLPTELWTKNPKIVTTFRNPKDVAISRYHLYRWYFHYSGSLELFLKAFVEDKIHHSPFWKQILDLWELRNQKNVLFLHYDEIIKDLTAAIRRTADFLEVKITEEEEKALLEHLSFDHMKKNRATNLEEEGKRNGYNLEESFIRKGERGSWRTVMSPEMIEMFDKWIEKSLKDTDFPRDNL